MSKINKMFVLRIVNRTTDGHVLFKLTRINWPEGSKKTEVIVSKLLWRASMHFSCLHWIVKIYQRVRHLNAVSICHSSMPTSQFGYVFSITYCVYGTYLCYPWRYDKKYSGCDVPDFYPYFRKLCTSGQHGIWFKTYSRDTTPQSSPTVQQVPNARSG